MEKRLNGVKLKLSRAAYRLAKNEGIEFGLSLIVLALAAVWLVVSSEADLTHVVDFTVFFAIVATMLLQMTARFTKNSIVNFIEDDIKLDVNYQKLAKRYPPIVYPDGRRIDPLITGNNYLANPKNLLVLRAQGVHSMTWRLPVVLDYGLPSETAIDISDAEEQYRLPEPIREHSFAIMEAHETSNIYNQLNIRVDEWSVDDGRFCLETSRTTYYDSLVTNRAMDFSWPTGATTRDQYQYGPFVPELSVESPLSNHLGFNGLIISCEGRIPFIRRNRIVSIGKSTYGTSIGAALKAKYALNADRRFAAAGLENAIVREIKDELKIEQHELEDFSAESGVIAAYRDLVEGGKPQLLFYARARLSSQEIEKRFRAEVAAAQKSRPKWDVEAWELEDGDEIVWLSVDELRQAAFSEDCMACAGHHLPMMPSSVASVVLFLRFAPQFSFSAPVCSS